MQSIRWYICTFIKLIISVILPPLAVLIEKGCGADLAINAFLTLLGYLSGLIHAVCVVTGYNDKMAAEQTESELPLIAPNIDQIESK